VRVSVTCNVADVCQEFLYDCIKTQVALFDDFFENISIFHHLLHI